jgi:hypothetical protein
MLRGVELQFKKFNEFGTKFEKKTLGYEPGVQVGTFYEKNGSRKSRATVPLKQNKKGALV